MPGTEPPSLLRSTILAAIAVLLLSTGSSRLVELAPGPAPRASPPFSGHSSIKGAYWPSSLAETFPPALITTTYFTHIYYAFVGLNSSSFELQITEFDDQWIRNLTSTLRAKSRSVKVFLSVGGAAANSSAFSIMCGNPAYRDRFIISTMRVAREYGLDGIDLDWEYPVTQQDMSNLAFLFQEWYETLVFESVATQRPRILISAAVYFASGFFLTSGVNFPADAINRYVDVLNVMCYDYRGSWDTSVTGEHALLYDNTSKISTSYGISSWIQAGLDPKKLVMGLPLYGRTWRLKDPNVHGIGAPAVGIRPGAQDSGTMTYSEILDFNFANFAVAVYDSATVSTYSYSGDIWIGYDGYDSTKEKVKYAKEQGIGGYFFWALGGDKDWTLSSAASNTWDSKC